MKKWLLIVALCVSSPCYGQIPSLLQSASDGATCAFASNVASGSVLIAVSEWETVNNTPTVSDNLGTPTVFSQAYFNTTQARKFAIYTGTTTVSGADTITFTVTSATSQTTQCAEFSFGGMSLTVDSSVITAFTSAIGSATSGNVTTTTNGDLLISMCKITQNSPLITQTDALIAENVGNTAGGSGFRMAGTNGNYATTYSFNGGTRTGVVVIVAFSPTAIQIVSPAALPDAIQGGTYSYTLQAIGGTGAYTWSITSGVLPLGLSLNTSTGAITGTATNSNPNTITFQVTDGTHTTTKGVTLHVGSGAATVTHVKDSSTSGVFTGNVTAGNLLVISHNQGDTHTIPECTDSLGTPFTLRGIAPNTVATSLQIWAGIAPSTGADTVTCAAGVGTGLLTGEFSGAQDFNDISAIQSAPTGSGTTLTTATVTTPAVNSLIIAGVTQGVVQAMTATAPCTPLSASTTFTASCWDVVATAAGHSESYTAAGDMGYQSSVITAFRPASTGTAPPPPSGGGTEGQIY